MVLAPRASSEPQVSLNAVPGNTENLADRAALNDSYLAGTANVRKVLRGSSKAYGYKCMRIEKVCGKIIRWDAVFSHLRPFTRASNFCKVYCGSKVQRFLGATSILTLAGQETTE